MRAVTARLARPEELDDVVPVLRAVRADSALGPQLVHADAVDVAGHLRAWFECPSNVLVVAESDEEIVGVAMAQVIGVGVLNDVTYLQLEALYVQAACRRRGAGRALMGQLALVAAQADAEQIVTMPVGGSRSEQRFLSGLGFSALGARRMIETAALLRRLEHQAKRGERRGRTLEDLIARRRRSRGLPPTPPAGVPLDELAERTREAITSPRTPQD